jgi:uncharacterized protein with NAD-binding domain and iron-sulfur cluster
VNQGVNAAQSPAKVAVLGGGVGGLTAAFELTATPQLRERYEVTVYQLGWRVGGKGASGRNAAVADRIEEHGLHVWFGFYDNAFRLMRDAYEELGREPGEPLATLEDAFKPCDQIVLLDRQDGAWHPLQLDCPRNLLRPGEAAELPTFWEMAASASRWALDGWRLVRDQHDEVSPEPDERSDLIPDWFENLARDVAQEVLELPLDVAERLLSVAERLASERARHTDNLAPGQAAQPLLLVRLLKAVRDWLWVVLGDLCERNPDLRFFFTTVDTGVAMAAGIVEDGVLEHGFDRLNDEEWSAWLARHGAKPVTIGRNPAERAPVLRSVYDVAFAYPEGDIGKANCAAGTATGDLLKLVFGYRGSIMYKMQAGMGDVVFTPLYEVLRRRGVRFEYFHAVTRLGLAPDADLVDAIDVVRQVELAPGRDEYDPLVPVEGLPCWPSEPRWDQLEEGARGTNFEAELNPLGRPARTLRRGTDFDQVVLGIPVGALPDICGELMERSERFDRGVKTGVTVRTQAFQLWAGRSSEELGWAHSENSVTGCFVEPLDTYCDMTHLIPRESWTPADDVKTIAYVCGVLEDREGEGAAAATARVRDNAIEFVERDLPVLWPEATSGGRFDWNVLVDRDEGSGRARFDAQYHRANVTAWERYVLTPAGSVEHRLPSGDSGFENLVLAGDWTRNGIDGGCVEAAAISGIEAARALSGNERPVPGRATDWLRQRTVELPPYIEYGGRATAPAPFACQGGRLRGLLLRGDATRIDKLVERMFNVPSGRGLDYRAFSSRVMMLVGDFARVTSLTPPFDRWGAVRETQASFFIPVLAGRDLGHVFLAERLLLAVPYILVDNPMSYLGGREIYGYAKVMGRFSPPEGLAERVSIEAFGGNFGLGEGAAWRPFLELRAGAARPRARRGPAESGPMGLLRHLVPDLPDPFDAVELAIADLRLGADLVGDLIEGRVGQVFLKQLRDAGDGTRACYQSVVEAPVRIHRVLTRPAENDWTFAVHHLDSHPIREELGLTDQRAELSFDIEIDFEVEDGYEIGRVTATGDTPAPQGWPAGPGGGPVDGYQSMLGSAARWLWRELTELERVSLGRLRGSPRDRGS